MRLKVEYGKRQLVANFPGDGPVSVGQVLQAVQNEYPEMRHIWCDSEGCFDGSLLVFINGEHMRYRKGLDTRLQEGDEIYVIPIIAGG